MELTYETLLKFDLHQGAWNKAIKDPSLLLKYIEMLNEIRGVDQLIKELPSFPGSTDKIIRGEMINAIGATLSIEGTIISDAEIEESFKKAEASTVLQKREQEAENSRKVYSFIIDVVRNNPPKIEYSEALIKQIHNIFTTDMNYVSNEPGKYRRDLVVPTFGVPRKASLCKTLAQTEAAMGGLVAWLNAPTNSYPDSDSFIKAIMAHYYLTEIHPFADGNGRTARALEALVLFANGINTYCFWSLANFWSLNKEEYLTHLHNIRVSCDPMSFIFWGLEGYLGEIKKIKTKVLKKVKQLMLMDYIKYLHSKKAHEIKINKRIVDVMRLLIKLDRVEFKRFMSSAEMIALYSSVSQPTKYRDFKKMISVKLIRIDRVGDVDYVEPNYRTLEALSYSL